MLLCKLLFTRNNSQLVRYNFKKWGGGDNTMATKCKINITDFRYYNQ